MQTNATDLQKMLTLDEQKPLKVAIVVDQNGRPLGDISPIGITVHAEPEVLQEPN